MWVHLCGCVCPFVTLSWCVFVRLSLVASAIASVRFPGHRRIACPSNWQPDRGGNSHNSHGQGRTPLLRPLWEILTIRYLLHFPLTFPRIFSLDLHFSSFYLSIQGNPSKTTLYTVPCHNLFCGQSFNVSFKYLRFKLCLYNRWDQHSQFWICLL